MEGEKDKTIILNYPKQNKNITLYHILNHSDMAYIKGLQEERRKGKAYLGNYLSALEKLITEKEGKKMIKITDLTLAPNYVAVREGIDKGNKKRLEEFIYTTAIRGYNFDYSFFTEHKDGIYLLRGKFNYVANGKERIAPLKLGNKPFVPSLESLIIKSEENKVKITYNPELNLYIVEKEDSF